VISPAFRRWHSLTEDTCLIFIKYLINVKDLKVVFFGADLVTRLLVRPIRVQCRISYQGAFSLNRTYDTNYEGVKIIPSDGIESGVFQAHLTAVANNSDLTAVLSAQAVKFLNIYAWFFSVVETSVQPELCAGEVQ
jgi:hypothetical protein